MWLGFAVTAASGLALLVADPVTKLSQAIFYVKLLFVALAVANMQMLWTRVFRNAAGNPGVVPPGARTLALTSLFFWLAATTSGRLIAYVY
jgi:multisubunit Na+/H+ antiporter MnhE subunit